MTVHVFFFYPETAAKSLEEIDAVFESKTPAWRTGQLGTFQDSLHEVERKQDGVETSHEEAPSSAHSTAKEEANIAHEEKV
ncbi:hypothetical protein DHEL01_v206331 [Diaporthe helianthi]|uniref:Uncharacterized protein n=1 Tax=Diaporthe helianthi TaxID=158607 RepID=A0A2P5HYE6_DIAHE|nr:hypothetical protein DHEL01_v206331 [Diaporthe helianthi]